MLILKNVCRTYESGSTKINAVDNLSLEIKKEQFVAITGPSGSGKSTLLGLLAGLDRPSSGSIVIDNTEISSLSEDELARWRGARLGYVFQNFQLISSLSALENVALPAEIARERNAEKRARELLASVGLAERANHFPGQLSGGEQQRVAIARALIRDPAVILADEPTGNLDSKTGSQILNLLAQVKKTAMIILVTHDAKVAAMAEREIQLADGSLYNDKSTGRKKSTNPTAKAKVKTKAKAKKSS